MPAAPPPAFTIVVPIRNARRFQPTCLDSVCAAAEAGGGEVIVVDNGSTDGTLEWLRDVLGTRIRLLEAPGVSISALRNLGATSGSAETLVFVDADCEVASDHLATIRAALDTTGADAVGSPYALPAAPHWVEAVWQRLHEASGDGDVPYLPGGNLAVRRSAFAAVGGFDERLETGEDAEFCQRLRLAGHRVRRVAAVRAIHHGNPKSLGAFYRKQRWHGLGMMGTVRTGELDKPVLMTAVHALFLGLAIGTLTVARVPLAMRALAALAALHVVPLAAVAYRMRTRGAGRAALAPAVLLYQVYFLARLSAAVRILRSR